MSIISTRAKNIKPSATLSVAAKANELRAQGQRIISLSTGEPDFDTPEAIKQAAITAIHAGFTKYTPVDGIPELKQAVISKFQQENQLAYEPQQILVSCGAKQSLYNLMQAIINPGDEVIIPAPYWVSYPDMVKIAEGVPVMIPTDIGQDYKISPQQLDAAINKNTKLFIINSPGNPSGKMYQQEELCALAEVLRRYPDVLIVTDDIYEHITWASHPFTNIVMSAPDLYDRSIVVNGVSKAYAMTGWRIGYAAGPADIIAAMKKIQSQSTSNPTSIAQKAATAALSGDQTPVKQMTAAFKQRHDLVYERLNAIPGIKLSPADGTFYLFVNIQAIIDKKGFADDIEFAQALIHDANVAVVPGTAFGAPGHVRLSFATSEDQLIEALNNIEQFCE